MILSDARIAGGYIFWKKFHAEEAEELRAFFNKQANLCPSTFSAGTVSAGLVNA